MILTQTKPDLNQSFLAQNFEAASTNSRLDSQKSQKSSENVSGCYQKTRQGQIAKATINNDWLTKIYGFADYDLFLEKTKYFMDALDDEIDFNKFHAGKIGRWFTTIFHTVRGGQVGINILEEGIIDCAYKLPGAVMAGADGKKLTRALLHMESWFIACTRFDTAYDRDDDVLIGLRGKAYQSWEQGLNSGFKELDQHIEGKTPLNKLITHDWGTNSSNRKIRIYDKPEIGKIRFEVQTRRDRADFTYRQLLADLKEGKSYVEALTNSLSIGIEGIEFYDSTKDVNLSRNKIADFWSEFKELIDYRIIKLPKIQITKSLEKSLRWIRKQVAPALAAISELYGKDFPDLIGKIKREGRERISPKHKSELERIKREGYEWMEEWNERELINELWFEFA